MPIPDANTSAANPKFARHCRESDCELRVQSGTGIITFAASYDSEVRIIPAANSGELRNRDAAADWQAKRRVLTLAQINTRQFMHVGVAGLGRMGAAMAARLAEVGYQVSGW